MTRQKNMKALVRDRMARTGETYTTARGHVAAHAPQRQAEPGTHAPSTLVRDLLARAGVVAPHTGEPFTEAMLAGLGGGIGFMYAVFEYKGFPHPTMTIVAQHHPDPFVPAILDRLGCATETTRTTSAKVADRRLSAALADGVPAVCTLDRSALPWLPRSIRPSATRCRCR
ncbi:MAG TPA: BtrH N-terminal domain-containing protein [Actinokineospora sp.]|nr:BtrH N-terminal domain-containing protein [Actinokineospora sp.]